jgi:hypothetical protein
MKCERQIRLVTSAATHRRFAYATEPCAIPPRVAAEVQADLDHAWAAAVRKFGNQAGGRGPDFKLRVAGNQA